MRKLLKLIWVIQERENHKVYSNLNCRYIEKRMNPFNPLTYISILIIFLVGLLMFGVIGFWSEVDLRNPFRWR